MTNFFFSWTIHLHGPGPYWWFHQTHTLQYIPTNCYSLHSWLRVFIIFIALCNNETYNVTNIEATSDFVWLVVKLLNQRCWLYMLLQHKSPHVCIMFGDILIACATKLDVKAKPASHCECYCNATMLCVIDRHGFNYNHKYVRTLYQWSNVRCLLSGDFTSLPSSWLCVAISCSLCYFSVTIIELIHWWIDHHSMITNSLIYKKKWELAILVYIHVGMLGCKVCTSVGDVNVGSCLLDGCIKLHF